MSKRATVEDILATVEAFSRTALDPSAWHIALNSFSSLLGAAVSSLELSNTATNVVRMEGVLLLEADVQRHYEERLFAINPRVTTALRSRTGDFIDDHKLLGGGLPIEFSDWLMRTPSRYFQGAKVLHHENEIGFISSHYDKILSVEAAAEAQRLYKLVLPHVVNAVAASRYMSGQALLAPHIGDPDLHGTKAFALLDSLGNILTCSTSFEKLIVGSTVLQISGKRLVASRAADRQRVQRFMHALIDGSPIGPPFPIRLSPDPNLRGIALRGIKMTPNNSPFSIFQPHAAIIVKDLDAQAIANRVALRELFQLTNRELDVASQILAGQSLDVAAHSLNISIYTAKQHLKSIFRKTNTCRQSDFVHLTMMLTNLS